MRRWVHGGRQPVADDSERGGSAGGAAGYGGPWPAGQEVARRPHQAAHERVHGVVETAAAQDRPGEPQDAQLGDIEAIR